jgi:hypothetical protein
LPRAAVAFTTVPLNACCAIADRAGARVPNALLVVPRFWLPRWVYLLCNTAFFYWYIGLDSMFVILVV